MEETEHKLGYAGPKAVPASTPQKSFGLDFDHRRNLRSLLILLAIGAVLFVGLLAFVVFVIGG